MKKILLIILILLVTPQFLSAQNSTSPVNDNQKVIFSPEPSLQLQKALQLAGKYIIDNNIDISHHYLDNIRLIYKSTWMEGKHWILTWKIKENFVDGGEIFIIVGMDKKIKMVKGL